MRRAGWALLGALPFLLNACVKPALKTSDHHIELSVKPASPADLQPGTIVEINARLAPEGTMEWVSGTVKIFHAPVLPFKKNPDGSFKFRTMVPPMTNVPSGNYEVKVWGRTAAGEDVEGKIAYEVR